MISGALQSRVKDQALSKLEDSRRRQDRLDDDTVKKIFQRAVVQVSEWGSVEKEGYDESLKSERWQRGFGNVER